MYERISVLCVETTIKCKIIGLKITININYATIYYTFKLIVIEIVNTCCHHIFVNGLNL